MARAECAFGLLACHLVAGSSHKVVPAGQYPITCVGADECYENCSTARRFYILGSLHNLIANEQSQHNPKETVRT